MNAAMLLLVASTLTPADSATPAQPVLKVSPRMTATFGTSNVPLAVPARTAPALPARAATPPQKSLRFFVGGGAVLKPGQNGVFGGGVSFIPMKDKPELALQGDVYIGFYSKTTTFAARAGEDGYDYDEGTGLFALIAFNLLYQLPIKLGNWKMHGGAGVMFDKASSTDVFFDVKLLFSYILDSGRALRPEIRFGFASYFAFIALFTYMF